MNLDLDETQTLLRDTAREFLEAEVSFDRVRELERELRWDEALWKAVADQGWLALPFAEASGGGGGLVDAGLLLEEFARRAALVPLAEAWACGIACPELAPAIATGGARVVPAVFEASDEPGRVDLAVEGGRLRGEKLFVDYGAFASHHLVAARDGDAPALFRVDASADRVCCEPLRTIGRTPSAKVRYDGAAVERVGDADAFARLVLLARAFAAVQCVGSAQQALDMTVRYTGVREAFGRPIASFQAVKHHAANMAIRVAGARFLAYEALQALGNGTATPRQVALAKASASRMVPEVTMLAHQLHGGNGIIEENDLYFFTLRGKDRSLAWGSAEECLAEAAGEVEAPRDWLG
ncbi:MAG: acyl-CoA dehydrogenase family protein [Myxococcota bacterium]